HGPVHDAEAKRARGDVGTDRRPTGDRREHSRCRRGDTGYPYHWKGEQIMLLKLKLAALSAMLIVGVGLGTYANADQTPAPVQTMPNSPGMLPPVPGYMFSGATSCDQETTEAMRTMRLRGPMRPVPE